MGLGYGKGAARRLRKTGGLVFWTVACSGAFLVCGRMLWLAYTTLSTIIPPWPGGGRWVLLDQEPLFFWSAIVISGMVFLCGPGAVATQISDLVECIRRCRRSLREKRL